MQGLLDWIKTPEGQGLLSATFGGLAGARRGAPLNSIGGAGMAGLMGYSGALERQDQLAERAKLNEFRGVQMDAYKADAAAKQAKAAAEAEELARRRAREQALPGLFTPASTTGGEVIPPMLGDVPMFSQPPVGITPTRTTPAGFDVLGAIRAGFKPEEIKQYAELPNVGRAKVARTVKGMGPDGREFEYQVDEFGQRIGEGLAQYRPPLQIGQGDRMTLVDPYNPTKPVGSFQINQSPDSRASIEATVRGQNMVDARAREANAQGKIPPGYRAKADGSLEAIPGGPADIKAGAEGERQRAKAMSLTEGAKSVLQEVASAKSLVGANTAGIGGVLANIPATEARNLQAKLGTIKANLGFDRLQQMRDQSPTGGALGQVAVQELQALQSTVTSLDQLQSPTQLSAALNKIERHYQNWLGVMQQAQGGQGGADGSWGGGEKSEPKNVVQQLPTNAPKGSRARDLKTGAIMVFDGMRWMPEGK